MQQELHVIIARVAVGIIGCLFVTSASLAQTDAKERASLDHASEVTAVAFSPDGKTLVSGCQDGTMKVWEVASRKELASMKAHGSRVASLAFSRDGKTLASGSFDSTVKVWDAPAWKERSTLKGHSDEV